VMSKAASLQLGGFATPPKVNRPCRFTRQTFLGQNCNFNGLEVQGWGHVRIGDNFHSGPDCLFITSMHDYDHGSAIPYGDAYVHKDITICDNVWLGSRVIVLGGVSLGEGCIIQAGAVVVKSIPPLAIAGGNPATVFKTRNADHYYRLKAAGSFH
jgi:chloramphenicol O-acetyltransferase type B